MFSCGCDTGNNLLLNSTGNGMYSEGSLATLDLSYATPLKDGAGTTQGWGNVLQDLAKVGANTASQIFTAKYGGPQPGVYEQTAQGVKYRLPEGTARIGFETFPSGSNTGAMLNAYLPLLIVGGLGIAVIKLLK